MANEKRVRLDVSGIKKFVREEEVENLRSAAEAARMALVKKSGAGSDYVGWVDLPKNYDRREFARIKKAAAKIRSDSEILFVVGIGGSYLGARAAVEALKGPFFNNLPAGKRGGPEIWFCGNSLSPDYLSELTDLIGGRDFSINVISKSGTTTEPAVAFRILKKLLIDRYGTKDAAKRIYATTDKVRGALKTEADAEGYETFVVPDDVGGRYSVLTAVGLLPIAASGADIDALMAGASDMRTYALTMPYEENDVMRYAAVRNILNRKGIQIEILENYEPALHYVGEWWKQLYGESEGKDGKGLYPAAVDLTTDLHSMGQYIQDGVRTLFETVIHVEKPKRKIRIEAEESDLDGLNYLAGKQMAWVNDCAMKGTAAAHIDGGVPNLRVELPARDEYALGQLFYFFEFACGVSGYLLGVNPFDQPGVEYYKRNMFRLLGKPGCAPARK